MRTSHFSDQEKRRLYALGGENNESELAARVLADSGSDTVADDWHHR